MTTASEAPGAEGKALGELHGSWRDSAVTLAKAHGRHDEPAGNSGTPGVVNGSA
jgi:hypothetical protein